MRDYHLSNSTGPDVKFIGEEICNIDPWGPKLYRTKGDRLILRNNGVVTILPPDPAVAREIIIKKVGFSHYGKAMLKTAFGEDTTVEIE